MNSLVAGWRVSLHRTLADWPIVAAAWLITVLAAILLSAGPIYSTAASLAGLQRTLAAAPAAETSIDASLYDTPTDAAAIDGHVQAELRQAMASVGGIVTRDWRGSATLTLGGALSGTAGNQGILGFLDGLPEHATLLGGDWPAASGSASGPIPVVVVQAVAAQLHLAVGDELSLVAHNVDHTVTVPARLAGIFAVGSADDPYWNGDTQLTSGVVDNGQYRTFGPFLTTENDLLQRAGVESLHLQWRATPYLDRLTVDEAGQLQGRLGALPERLRRAAGQVVDVKSGLPAILGATQRSLLVSSTGVLLLIAQLAVLAAYAIVLTASLLVDHRRMETALLRSRGAGPTQVALLAFVEGLVLAIPAVLLAPWLAVGALSLLNVVGPLADVGLNITPRVTVGSYLAAGAVGIVCVALLVLPALLAARGFAAEQRELSRQETRTFGQRMGLDIALLAIAGIALWQLRLYGAPLTRTVQGSLGLDPLLVAAPAISLLAGGILALRLLPLMAEAIETTVSRGRDLVTSLGSRQLARRPLRYTRSALLLMIAMSMGVFALSYTSTWSSSQHDQAEYQVGADLRVETGRSLGAVPFWALPHAYAGLADVEHATPVERIPDEVSSLVGSSDLLALDADTAPGVVLFRADEATRPLDELMRTLREGRPAQHLNALPDGTTTLRIVPRLEIRSIGRFVFDPATGDGHEVKLDPTALPDVRVSASAIVRDARGLLYRVQSLPAPVEGPPTAIVLPLEPTAVSRSSGTAAQVRLLGPVELAGLEVDVWLPIETETSNALLGVAGVSAGGGAEGPWTAVPLTSAGTWTARFSGGTGVFSDVPADQVEGTAIQLGGEQLGPVFGNGQYQAAARVSLMPASIGSMDAPIPVIANQAFLASTGSATGDIVFATFEGVSRRLRVAAAVDDFPTTDPARPLLIMDEATLGLVRLQGTSDARAVDEWWLAARPGSAEALISTLRGGTFSSPTVFSVVDRTRGLSTDPVAIGILGALMLGAVATGLFAIVGLAVSAAVSARERRTEFALLRALGLSGRQLSGWLWLENGSLVLVSLLLGTGLGLLTAWLVLPFVTVTQQATAPVPPILVDVPWDRILLLDLLSALALGLTVVAIARVLRRLGVGSVLRMGED